jgi:NADH-quinone oxidoreductase subunit C
MPDPTQPEQRAVSAASAPAKADTQGVITAAELHTNPLAHLTTAFQSLDYTTRGCHYEAAAAPDSVVKVAEELDRDGFALDTITGVDWKEQDQMEIIYDYFHPAKNLRVAVKTRIPRSNPEILTISNVFQGANWHERETHDFFGIRFIGHPNLTPFLLPEDADYHPLRKDFVS